MESNTILIVDDQGDLRSVFRLALELDGFEILEAANGREAMERLRSTEGSRRPCLIFLDLLMPEMGGEDFLEWVSLEPGLQDIPVVVMSATPGQGFPPHASLGHARRVVRKPLELDVLTTTARMYTSQGDLVH